MRSLSTFTILLLALMATLAMLSYTGATPIEAPANTDVQDPKSDPPSVNDNGESFVPNNDDFYSYRKCCGWDWYHNCNRWCY